MTTPLTAEKRLEERFKQGRDQVRRDRDSSREQRDKLVGLLERANDYVPTIDIQLKREIHSTLVAALKEEKHG